MTQDESGQSSELTPATASESNESMSPAGTSSAPPDIDERPIGACHLEMLEIKAAVAAVRAANARAQAALAKFWACRDAAKTVAGVPPANHYRGLYQASIFDSLADQIQQLANMIENFQ